MITYIFNQLAGIGATGIDNDSDIIYMSRLGFNRFFDHGTFVLKGGQVFSIGPFGEPFDALNALDATADINDLSQIVGPLKYTGVLGSLNENGMFTFQTFAGPGGSSGHTAPTGINDNGQVVGYFNSFSGLNENGGYHSFVGMTLSPVTGQSFTWSMVPSVVLDDPALSANGLITGGTYAEMEQQSGTSCRILF